MIDYSIYFNNTTKYLKYYLSIVKKPQNDSNYGEYHHVLPKSIYPQYQNLKTHKWNSVHLNYREHYICHLLLWKHYKSINDEENSYKMRIVIKLMMGHNKYNSKQYGIIKEALYNDSIINIDIDWLKQELQTKNINQIARENNLNEATIRRRVEKHKLHNTNKHNTIFYNYQYIKSQLEIQSVKELSEDIECSEQSLRNYINKNGLKDLIKMPNRNKLKITKEDLIMLRNKYSVKEICQKYKVSKTSYYRIMRS